MDLNPFTSVYLFKSHLTDKAVGSLNAALILCVSFNELSFWFTDEFMSHSFSLNLLI